MIVDLISVRKNHIFYFHDYDQSERQKAAFGSATQHLMSQKLSGVKTLICIKVFSYTISIILATKAVQFKCNQTNIRFSGTFYSQKKKI